MNLGRQQAVYYLTWLVDHRVLYVKLDGPSDLLDLQSMSMDVRDYLDAGSAPVHLVLDVSTWRFEMSAVLKARESVKEHLDRPDIGSISVYGLNSGFLQFVGTALTQLFNKRFTRCRSLDEALSHLCDSDLTLLQPCADDAQSEPTTAYA